MRLGTTIASGLCVICFVVLLALQIATTQAEPKGSFFYSGGYDEHVEVAKLTLNSATTCSGGFYDYDDLNYLSCGSDAPYEDRYYPGEDEPLPAPTPPDTVSRVGWCSIFFFRGKPADSSYNLFIGDFVADCHINSDAGCPDSLGCSNLDISVQGLAYGMLSNIVLTVEPRLAVPPFSSGCPQQCCGPPSAKDSSKDGFGRKWGRNRSINNKPAQKAPQVPKVSTASLLSSYDYDGPLPAKVWVLDPDYTGGGSAGAAVYGGQATVFDRQAKREVGTGWLDFAQLGLVYEGNTPTNKGWKKISSSEIPAKPVVIRDPYVYKFTFTKEVKGAPYAN